MDAPKFQSQSIYKISQDCDYKGDDFWDWSVWIDAAEDELDKIEYVTYVLHPTFKPPVKKVEDRASHFRLIASGWGTFTLFAKLHMKNGGEVHLELELELFYPEGLENSKLGWDTNE